MPAKVPLCPTTDDVARWPDAVLKTLLSFGELAVAKPYVLDRLRAEAFARGLTLTGGAK